MSNTASPVILRPNSYTWVSTGILVRSIQLPLMLEGEELQMTNSRSTPTHNDKHNMTEVYMHDEYSIWQKSIRFGLDGDSSTLD